MYYARLSLLICFPLSAIGQILIEIIDDSILAFVIRDGSRGNRTVATT